MLCFAYYCVILVINVHTNAFLLSYILQNATSNFAKYQPQHRLLQWITFTILHNAVFACTRWNSTMSITTGTTVKNTAELLRFKQMSCQIRCSVNFHPVKVLKCVIAQTLCSFWTFLYFNFSCFGFLWYSKNASCDILKSQTLQFWISLGPNQWKLGRKFEKETNVCAKTHYRTFMEWNLTEHCISHEICCNLSNSAAFFFVFRCCGNRHWSFTLHKHTLHYSVLWILFPPVVIDVVLHVLLI